MTHDEARAELVRLGAQVIDGRVKAVRAERELTESGAEALIAATFSVSEQYECFRASCVLAGVDPDGPEVEDERQAFEGASMSKYEARLLAQLANATLN